MIEAEILCECGAIQLPDLQLALTKGMVVYIEANKARQSADLQRAWKAKGVSVKYVQRFRERRPEVQSHPAMSVAPPVTASPLEHLSMEAFNSEALAQRVVELLTPKIQNLLRHYTVGTAQPVVLPQPQGAKTMPSGTVAVVEDIPVFIPSKIGRDDLQASVAVAAVEEDAGGVADAVAALKAARKSEKSK